MTVGTIARYLIGDAQAIREAAASKATFWIGIILVLITSIPRNYDQTYILEKPFLWVFGPLLFSIVSGTWLFLITYLATWRRHLPKNEDGRSPRNPHAWRTFMGVFWLTAPIAWLYAIPVERFMDSVSAAKANVALLSVVSLWRVLLMTRIIQVLSGMYFVRALLWVLIPASVEVLVLAITGETLMKRVLAGMGGMRNSPEEEVLISAVSAAFVGAFWAFPSAIILTWLPWLKCQTSPLPELQPTRVPYIQLTIIAIVWMAVAIPPQRQMGRNWHWEHLIAKKEYAEALSYAAQFARSDFAPARPLPPKAFERTVFKELPLLIGAVKGDEPAWLREHLIERLDEMCSHWKNEHGGARFNYDKTVSEPEQIESITSQLGWHGPDDTGFKVLLEGLQHFPEGQNWLKKNRIILAAIRSHLSSPPESYEYQKRFESNARAAALKILDELGIQPMTE